MQPFIRAKATSNQYIYAGPSSRTSEQLPTSSRQSLIASLQHKQNLKTEMCLYLHWRMLMSQSLGADCVSKAKLQQPSGPQPWLLLASRLAVLGSRRGCNVMVSLNVRAGARSVAIAKRQEFLRKQG